MGKIKFVDDCDLGNTTQKPNKKRNENKEKIQKDDPEADLKKVTHLINNSNCNWKMHTINLWSSSEFEFVLKVDIKAMDPKKKDVIMRDLVALTDSEEYYKRTGEAWNMSYLLYEPLRTCKIANMVNLMSYSSYYLELTSIRKNWELRKMLLAMASKFIIDLQDIDCPLDPTREREDKGDQRNKEIRRRM
ncbi:unnamed protein product [Eruca vesicaria subsp. sativa]|uniref:Uncharacterized protein n=1 Tax=Eruca vesicaria subsp. sativa TaxID=29727 RepID=A0ABC8IVX6_ERUVS|nr:unnamed protein product [Eruca vesicaria subsp. sativa]